jgi:arylsulfatase
LALAALAIALGALFLFAIEARADVRLEGSRPNIVLIITDDQGYTPIGRHGHPWIRTPNLDELHDRSVRFTRFLVQPTCAPTRSALMTGRHAMRNGVTHTILERERMTLKATTLPQVLQAARYETGIFGKWHLGDEEPYQPHNRGFRKTFIHGAGGIGQAYNCSCADVPDNDYFNPIIRHNGSFVQTEGFCTDVFFDAALSWIHKVKDLRSQPPFFAYIATNAPHAPYVAPEKNVKRFTDLGFPEEQAGYYAMIENIDENVGRLTAKLGEWNLLDETVIIFMSDNGMDGPGSGAVGAKGKGKPLGTAADGTTLAAFTAGMKGFKNTPDEGGVRVPFFVRWDGRIEPGRDLDRIAADIDIFPTLVSLAKGTLPENQVEGRDLLPLIQDPKREWPDRYLFAHIGRWPTGADPDKFQWQNFAVRNQRFRFVNNDALFDMESDPGQTKNVIADHPEVARQMRDAYDAWWKETRPLMVNEAAPLSKTRPFHELYRKQQQERGIPKWETPKL